MSEAIRFFRKFLELRLSELHTALLGRITAFVGNTANVQPLDKNLPLLINLPMLKQSYEYKIGDTVLVVFLERARDGAGNRKHSLEDGVVIGVIE